MNEYKYIQEMKMIIRSASRYEVARFGLCALAFLLLLFSVPDIVRNYWKVTLLRLMMQTASIQWSNSFDNPFLCYRPPLSNSASLDAIRSLLSTPPPGGYNVRLTAAAYCLLSESSAALATYQASKHLDQISFLQEYAILTKERDPSLSLQQLITAPLTDSEWDQAADIIVNHELKFDPRLISRVMVERMPADRQTWVLWLNSGSRIHESRGWVAALDWYQEGLRHPSAMIGSLGVRAGRILQTEADPKNFHAALTYFNLALSKGGFINTEDESNAYTFRGEVYWKLPKEFSPSQSLAEFDQALKLNPDSIEAWLSKGHVYLYDLNDPDRAEPIYRHALLLDPKSPYAYFYLAEITRARGNLEQAKAFYTQALIRKPDWQEPKERLKSLMDNQ